MGLLAGMHAAVHPQVARYLRESCRISRKCIELGSGWTRPVPKGQCVDRIASSFRSDIWRRDAWRLQVSDSLRRGLSLREPHCSSRLRQFFNSLTAASPLRLGRLRPSVAEEFCSYRSRQAKHSNGRFGFSQMQQATEQLHAKITQLENENGVLQQVINAISDKPKRKAKMEPPEKYRGDKDKLTGFIT
ncbi:hypothetical protein VTK56DRAFT_4320 [Thermocarpiscus australiensis]